LLTLLGGLLRETHMWKYGDDDLSGQRIKALNFLPVRTFSPVYGISAFCHNAARCCGSGMFFPDPYFSIPNPESRADKAPDHGYPTKNIGNFNPIICVKCPWKNFPCCLLLFPDPGSGFFPIPDTGVKKAPDPDPQHRCHGNLPYIAE
jgi:hypothetical protein